MQEPSVFGFLKFIGAGIIGMFLFFVIITVVIVWPLMEYDCAKLGINTQHETKYEFFGGGCLVRLKNAWVPRDVWGNSTR